MVSKRACSAMPVPALQGPHEPGRTSDRETWHSTRRQNTAQRIRIATPVQRSGGHVFTCPSCTSPSIVHTSTC
eukprot:10336134-Alexandrium_andersonii.AAC.1